MSEEFPAYTPEPTSSKFEADSEGKIVRYTQGRRTNYLVVKAITQYSVMKHSTTDVQLYVYTSGDSPVTVRYDSIEDAQADAMYLSDVISGTE